MKENREPSNVSQCRRDALAQCARDVLRLSEAVFSSPETSTIVRGTTSVVILIPVLVSLYSQVPDVRSLRCCTIAHQFWYLFSLSLSLSVFLWLGRLNHTFLNSNVPLSIIFNKLIGSKSFVRR